MSEESTNNLDLLEELNSSILKNFFCKYYIDIKSGHFQELKSSTVPEVRDVIGASGDASEKFMEMSDKLVTPEYKFAVLKFCNLSDLAERLSEKEAISIEFYGPHVGWCAGTFIAARRDENGVCTHAYWVVQDIDTEKGAVEQGQREALQAFESVHDALGSANWQMNFDENGVMTSCIWSDRFREMLGYSSLKDFPNRLTSWTNLLHPEDKDKTLNAYWAAVNDRTGQAGYSVEYRLLTKNDGYRWFAAHGSVIRYKDGTPKIFYGLFMDIHDQFVAEQSMVAHLDAINSLSKVYYATFYVDMDNGDYYELLANDDVNTTYASFGPQGNAQVIMDWMCEERIAPEFREQMKIFGDYSTLSERMKDTDSISIRARLITGDWMRIRFIAGTRHEDGTLKTCTFVVRDINSEVAEEKERQNVIQQALDMAQESSAEQEAQLEEITALNTQLQDNQTRLEEASAEQEAQLEEISALNAQLEENRANLERSLGILGSLSHLMQHIYYIDMRDRSLVKLGNETVTLDDIVSNKKDAQASMEFLCREVVVPGQAAFMREFSDLTTIDERLKDREFITAQFRNQEGHWLQGSFIVVARGDDGRCTSLIWAVRNIDEFKLKEIKDREQLSEYNDIMANAGFGMWHIILKDGAAPRMQANTKMAELLGVYGENMTEEEMYDAWYGRIVPEAIPSVQASVGEMLAGHFSENTYQWVHPQKGKIYVRCGGTAVRLADGTNVLRGYHADVTDIVYEEKKHTEELEQAREAAEAERGKLSLAYGMIKGFSTEYHTIWVVSKETSEMRLIRSTGVTTIQGAVQMGKDLPKFDEGFDKYINTYIEPEDRARMKREIAFAEILRHLEEEPNEIYAVNYLRRDDSGHVGYHQIAFANADTETGVRQFVYGFRDIDKIVKEEQKQKEELQQALEIAQEATAEQEAQLEEITALNAQLQDNQSELEASVAEQEAQLTVIEEERQKVSQAYGMIKGLSSEYHTIWVVSKETSKMKLVRSSGNTTIQRAVQMGIDEPEYDPAFDTYIESCIEPEDRERMHREIAFSEVMRHLTEHPDEIYAVNYLRRDDSGHVGYHQIAFVNADTDTGVKQFVYGFRDIDRMMREELAQKEELRLAKEDAEAANAAKTSFLFNMSHDIRTPMNAIMGFRDLLEKHQDDPEKRQDYLDKIQDSSSVLLSIINNVLEMARIEKGTLEIDDIAWSTEQFNDTLYSVFREMMEQKGLTFTRQIEVEHHYVFCDPTKLREIFINILSNSYKYTNPGGKVNMHLEEVPSDREGWVLYRTTVTDTGIGMSEEFIPHIFDEFARENNTTDAKVEGTGLGMPIVKRLVDMLGGTIEVRSVKGEGSTFIVTIPHKIAERADLVDHAGVEIDPKMFKDKHILLAEDNDLNAEIAIEILREAGFIVDRADDGAICVDMLERAEAGHYDLVLMDIQMPNMNGYEAARAIRAMDDQDKANTKILAMTANAFEEDKREALRAGMNGHLAKPINVNELMKTLAWLIG